MSAEWISTTWGEIASLEYGKAIRDYQDADGTYIVYGTNGPIGKHHTPLCNHPSVIVGRKGAYRGIHYSAKPFFVIDTAFYLKPKAKLNTKWAYYCLLTYDINGMDSGSAIPSTSRDEFYKLPVLLPSENECNQIAEYLTAFDDRIALLRETNATLEAMAQALFKSWFVDFDPVHANAGNRAAMLPAELQALFPSTFTATPQGPVPEGWSCGVVGDVALQKKGSVNPLQAPEKLFEHYSLPAFDNSQIPVLEQGEQIKSNKTPLPPNAVLLSKLNPHIPRVWLPFEYGDNAVCSTEFLAYSPINGASKEFIYTLFTSATFLMSLRQLVTGTSNSHQRVKPDHVLGLELVIPSKDVLVEFEKVTNPLFERIGQNRQQSQTLATLRDTLLPRLISGQLRLPDAEAALVEVGV